MSEDKDVKAMRNVLLNLVDAVDATGGVVTDDHGYIVPVADPDWIDLGAVYADACQVLGREMKRA